VKRETKLALALLLFSFIVLFAASAREPLGAGNSDYAALVNQAEEAVRVAAARGVRALAGPESRGAIEQLGNRPLAPLLSAWSALSFGRLGILDGSSCLRLPWLILAALLPLSLFLLLRARFRTRTAAVASLWLLLSPGFIDAALSVRASMLAIAAGWLVVAASACALRQRSPSARCWLLLASAACAWIGCGLSFAVTWIIPVLLLHAWIANRERAERLLEHGYWPLPNVVLVALVALPIAVYSFDPLLWHGDVPALIRRVFEEDDSARAFATGIGSLILPGLFGLVGILAMAHAALARRFATGEFRPSRDASALGGLLTAGLICCAICGIWDSASSRELGLALLRPLLACLVAVGAAFVAERLSARHARFVEPLLVALTLLVR
jgi:hypothetical protein